MDHELAPPDPGLPLRAVRTRADRVPGQRDMSSFEQVVAGPDADGPRLVWLVVWPDGRVTPVDSEDDALVLARGTPRCRLTRRYVTPGVSRPTRSPVGPDR